jgi:phosphoglycerol transferase MdoB-like AlkP superfamily enzyme
VYFGGFIGYEQVFMFNDLLDAIKYTLVSPLIVMCIGSIMFFYIGWLVYTKNLTVKHQLSVWEKWRAPFFYCVAGIIVTLAHGQRYNHIINSNVYLNNEEFTYDYNTETPVMYFLRSLPLFVQLTNKEEFDKHANLKILANTLKSNVQVKLPEQYHFKNFANLLTPYPGYTHQKNPLEPLLFTPNKVPNTITKNTKKTNVMFIVLESLRSYETGLYNSDYSFTPNLDKISKQAIVASNFYSTSRTTVQAEQAILCSSLDFASRSPYSVRSGSFNGKCLPKLLSEENYDTSWYHGYSKTFFNREVFHPSLGFNNLFSKEKFIENGYTEDLDIGWGVPDHIAFKRFFDDLIIHNQNSNFPFFTQILTLTNHQPFNWNYTHVDFPAQINKESDDIYSNYLKGIYYTDNALGHFWKKFNNSSLTKNTIVVITADHGVPFYPEDITNEAQKHEILYRVPLLIVTPDRLTKTISTPLSHLDIAPTILSLLEINKSVSFAGRPILGKNKTLESRPLFHMNASYVGFQYDGMQCLPDKSVCKNEKHSCTFIFNSYCNTKDKQKLAMYEQSKSFTNYLNLAVEAGYPSLDSSNTKENHSIR